MAETKSVRVTHSFKVPADHVFDAWLNPTQAGKWLFATDTGEMVRVEIDARVGGSFRFVDRRDGEDIEHVGEYLTIERPHRLVFDFAVPKYSTQKTRVAVEIEAQGTGCVLGLTHDGIWSDYVERTRAGWTQILDRLNACLSPLH
jgi:uncharacterized protein YndB with AHSA1/START domain